MHVVFQPLKMMSAAGILSETKNGIAILFKVENLHALEFIAQSDWNAYEFLCLYIEKTLKDSDVLDADGFFVQEYTIHVAQPLYPDANKSKSENIEMLKQKN